MPDLPAWASSSDVDPHAPSHVAGGSDPLTNLTAAQLGFDVATQAELDAAIAAQAAASVNDGDAAGGVLAGTYPNPGFAADMATQAELDAHAADATAIHGIADTALLLPNLVPVTVLPGAPVDGQIVVFQADATNGIFWMLRFRNAGAAGKKWEFLGGPSLYSEIATSESTASTSYAALATAGPQITLPLAGDYMVEIGCDVNVNTAAFTARMSYDIGGAAAVDADSLRHLEPTAGNTNAEALVRTRRKNALTAVALTAKYLTGGGTSFFANRWMRVTPVRVG